MPMRSTLRGMRDCTLAQGDYYQRRMDRAHRRYLEAVTALAKLRRLQVTVVQDNIGDRQVNVASGTKSV